MFVKFFTEYINEDNSDEVPSREFRTIAYKYITGEFLMDLIPLVPL